MEENILKNIADKIVDYAPSVAAAITTVTGGTGAPLGIALTALSSLGKAFGLGDKASPEDILKTINADPDIALKARIADQDYSLKMRQADIEELKTQLSDVQSARQRQIEHEKTTGKSDKNLYVLSWLIISGFFVLTGALIYFSYNGKTIEDGTGVLFMLLGTLSTAFGCVIQYFFGSSKGSADKSSLLATIQGGKK